MHLDEVPIGLDDEESAAFQCQRERLLQRTFRAKDVVLRECVGRERDEVLDAHERLAGPLEKVAGLQAEALGFVRVASVVPDEAQEVRRLCVVTAAAGLPAELEAALERLLCALQLAEVLEEESEPEMSFDLERAVVYLLRNGEACAGSVECSYDVALVVTPER